MGGLFGAKRPKQEPPTALPDEDDPAIKEEARRKRQSIASREGRASTILTGAGGGYSNTQLGQ